MSRLRDKGGDPLTCALLGCGPSLTDYGQHEGDYDYVIGINRAVEKYHCTHWSFGDFMTFQAVRPLGDPILNTHLATAYYLSHCAQHDIRRLFMFSMNILWEDTVANIPIGDRWLLFSSVGALALAAYLGANDIHTFGIDWTGDQDWDGATPEGCTRTPERWMSEQKKWTQLIDTLSSQVRVTRGGDTWDSSER